MKDVHASASTGYTRHSGNYEQGRPDYPAALQGWLRDTLGIGPGTAVLDLGAGTGKFTRLLEPLAPRLTAVEPVAAMRERFSEGLPEVPVLEGTAQRIPVADASQQVLVCAQAFHWFADAEALAEMHRVLAPGGRLGLIWNVRDETVDWVARITDIITPYEGDTPRFHTGRWREAFDGRWFSAPQLTTLPHAHEGSPRTVILERLRSVSFIAALPAAEQDRVMDQLQALIDNHPDLKGRDRIAFPYRTQAYVCQRLA
ncbi:MULTISPECIES: class I SAM-dependent methyltransferase [unclassified Pseudomonas]|uniref:class I SAM-dependent methyltransferase n=1 Tax=unclassified Pseudomonas TaxID=196821 RepID=UPI00244BF1FC|nr:MULTISPECIES: class I SAM-dependent methyltransferase [unclassified Pseudomonas]MDH0301950.1 methyltransferase domain-containing protein [Pseudomonas sp. GD04091]MDH1985701.1 methyltransferase domain-containing protein [Pseudomonas sp. GD03689]